MRVSQFDKVVEQIYARDPRIEKAAYHYLRETMDFTTDKAKEDGAENNHVSATELLLGFRDYSLNQFGPMAATIFDEWNLTQCSDIGDMVFALIDSGIFSKQESDTQEDFTEVFTFHEAFVKPFRPEKSKSLS